jgi:hypothetical protein
MQTARLWDAARIRPERLAALLGRLFAVAIILVPLAAMLFPELNHRSGNTPRGPHQTPLPVQVSLGGSMSSELSLPRSRK